MLEYQDVVGNYTEGTKLMPWWDRFGCYCIFLLIVFSGTLRLIDPSAKNSVFCLPYQSFNTSQPNVSAPSQIGPNPKVNPDYGQPTAFNDLFQYTYVNYQCSIQIFSFLFYEEAIFIAEIILLSLSVFWWYQTPSTTVLFSQIGQFIKELMDIERTDCIQYLFKESENVSNAGSNSSSNDVETNPDNALVNLLPPENPNPIQEDYEALSSADIDAIIKLNKRLIHQFQESVKRFLAQYYVCFGIRIASAIIIVVVDGIFIKLWANVSDKQECRLPSKFSKVLYDKVICSQGNKVFFIVFHSIHLTIVSIFLLFSAIGIGRFYFREKFSKQEMSVWYFFLEFDKNAAKLFKLLGKDIDETKTRKLKTETFYKGKHLVEVPMEGQLLTVTVDDYEFGIPDLNKTGIDRQPWILKVNNKRDLKKEDFGHLENSKNLEALSISNCYNFDSSIKLPTCIKRVTFEFTVLTGVDLTYENLEEVVLLQTKVNENFELGNNLKKLILSRAPLIKLGNLKKLTHLKLCSCGLKKIPKEIEAMEFLVSLEMQNNEITIPDSYVKYKLEHCEKLNLMNNKIERLPHDLFETPRLLLKNIFLEGNPIKKEHVLKDISLRFASSSNSEVAKSCLQVKKYGCYELNTTPLNLPVFENKERPAALVMYKIDTNNFENTARRTLYLACIVQKLKEMVSDGNIYSTSEPKSFKYESMNFNDLKEVYIFLAINVEHFLTCQDKNLLPSDFLQSAFLQKEKNVQLNIYVDLECQVFDDSVREAFSILKDGEFNGKSFYARTITHQNKHFKSSLYDAAENQFDIK